MCISASSLNSGWFPALLQPVKSSTLHQSSDLAFVALVLKNSKVVLHCALNCLALNLVVKFRNCHMTYMLVQYKPKYRTDLVRLITFGIRIFFGKFCSDFPETEFFLYRKNRTVITECPPLITMFLLVRKAFHSIIRKRIKST